MQIDEIQKQKKIRDKLDRLKDWTPDELREELATWSNEEIIELWELLEKPYRDICRGFGLASGKQRVSPRGILTDRQIKRLSVIHEFATMAQKER